MCGVSAITANTRSSIASVTHSPNRSVMEQTNTLRGFRHRSGCVRVVSSR